MIKLDGLGFLVYTGFFSIFAAILVIPYIVYVLLSEPNWKKEAIERGYAQYCPNDGRFAWEGECTDE